jgi:hypothetical protein
MPGVCLRACRGLASDAALDCLTCERRDRWGDDTAACSEEPAAHFARSRAAERFERATAQAYRTEPREKVAGRTGTRKIWKVITVIK